MPHDVTMPQLGMAQDAGKIVSWLKGPGDAVAKGDALFEVETDKAVMEVEAQAAGFLTNVTANAGDDVPVGQTIARISDSAEGETEAPAPAPAKSGAGDTALPDGHSVTMPQLGMAQDSGVLVSWLKSPGDELAADDVLFEVETDKSTMEVEAGRNGWLAATLAMAGEEVPVGQPVAIISDTRPDAPVTRSLKDGAPAAPAPTAAAQPEPKPADPIAAKPKPPAPAAQPGGRILASPKARRLALEQGLDLQRLVQAGHPQPYHAADLDVLRALPDVAPATTAATAQPRRLTAACASEALDDFTAWAGEAGIGPGAVLAGLAGASLAAAGTTTVAVDRFGVLQSYEVPPRRTLSAVAETEAPPALILRDLRGTPVISVQNGAENVPVLTLTTEGAGLRITLECGADQMDAQAAIRLLTDFAGRAGQPLRHLL